MPTSYTTARERSSTFIYACPTVETVRKLREYVLENKIPNPAGFKPSPLFHVTILRNAAVFRFPWPDTRHYHRSITVKTKGRAPDVFVAHHRHYATIGIHAPGDYFTRRHNSLHQFVGMRADPQYRPHLMLSYWSPVQAWRLPPFDFDMEFDHERVSDLMPWVRPRGLHAGISREKQQLAHVREQDIRRGR